MRKKVKFIKIKTISLFLAMALCGAMALPAVVAEPENAPAPPPQTQSAENSGEPVTCDYIDDGVFEEN